jgi:hypothetical protein
MVDVHGKIPQWLEDNWRYPPSNGENGWKGWKRGPFQSISGFSGSTPAL